MNPRLLIDAIVQQTTILIAQLSTAAGIRSPLARVADQIFLSLAEEIERQGVGRKVVADMFGLALRSYQRKVQRLTESATVGERTLWEAVLDHVTANSPVRRSAVLERFKYDDDRAVIAVLNDLVTSGLIYSSGRGDSCVYGVTSDAARRELSGEDSEEGVATLLWGTVFHHPGVTTADLVETSRIDRPRALAALSRLLADGRVSRDGDSDDAPLRAASFVIPLGAKQGWEAAIFDHYQALANAIAAKVRSRTQGESDDERLGGSTLHFGVYPGHPFEHEVYGSLARVRAEMIALWNKVSAFNEDHPTPDEAATRVTFYFGQNVREPADPELASRLDAERK